MMDVQEAHAAESGSRLKARWQVGEDGARAFINWYDSELDAECYFAVGLDGQYRCLPYVRAATLAGYEDAACSLPVFLVAVADECGAAPVFGIAAVQTDNGACANVPYEFYRMGPSLVPEQLFGKSGESCVATAVVDGRTYLRSAGAVALSSFAAGTVVIE